MGSHRADPRAPGRRASDRSEETSTTASTYVGKRVAARSAAEPVAPIVERTAPVTVDTALPLDTTLFSLDAAPATYAPGRRVAAPAPTPVATAPVVTTPVATAPSRPSTTSIDLPAVTVAPSAPAPITLEAPIATTPVEPERPATPTPVAPASSLPGRRARRDGDAAASPAPTLVSVANVRASKPLLTVELPALSDIQLDDALVDPGAALRAVGSSGKRRAARPARGAAQRNPFLRVLPSMPVAVGVAALAVSIGGVVTSTDQVLASAIDRPTSPNAISGSFGSGAVGDRGDTLSRDSDRDALSQAAGGDLVAEAERHAEERNSAINDLLQKAQKVSAEIALNRWVLPIDPSIYRLTATYGEYGLWSSYHTGLDFAAPSGTSIRAVANGVITSTGFDGAYGNKTVLTLEDGTELWFCHQSDVEVSVGDTVRAGDLIGYVGTTGHVTGAHLHLEVRPGGGDPVDPYAALRANGVTP